MATGEQRKSDAFFRALLLLVVVVVEVLGVGFGFVVDSFRVCRC